MPMSKSPLAPYRTLRKTVGPKIGLRTRIAVRPIPLPRGWYFDERAERKTIIIYAPPYDAERTAPTFVHYLGHAKLLEDGWPRVAADVDVTNPALRRYLKDQSPEKRQNTPHYWASRSEDSFFDFYVWLFICKKMGTSWLERFLSPVTEKDAETMLRFLNATRRGEGFDVYRYLYCLDWFAMLRTLADLHGLEGHRKKLDAKYKALLEADMLTPRYSKKIPRTIFRLRKFYKELHGSYSSHRSLLRNKTVFRHHFDRYYRYVWRDLGINITLYWDE